MLKEEAGRGAGHGSPQRGLLRLRNEKVAHRAHMTEKPTKGEVRGCLCRWPGDLVAAAGGQVRQERARGRGVGWRNEELGLCSVRRPPPPAGRVADNDIL